MADKKISSDQPLADKVHPAPQGPSQVRVDKCDVIGDILPGMDLAIASLFKGQYDVSQATRLPDARVEESPALVDSSDCTSNCRGFSPQVNPTHPSLRRLGAGSSGFTPCLSAPKRASSCKLVPFFGNLIALLPSELVLLDEVAIHSVSSLSEKPRARSLSPVGSRGASSVKTTDAAPQPKTKPKPYKIPKTKAVTPDDSRVLRAATPALSLWSELQAARNDQKTAVDVNKLITLAEASVCALGQASVEVKFQRRMAVASRILKDKKKAKNVIHQNADVLENEKKYLFGSSFTKQLVKRISRSNKLKETLLKVQNWKAFKKSGRGKSRQFQPSKPYHRPTATTTSTEAHNQPFQQGPRGTSTNRGGKGRGKKPYSRYVPICLSEQKSICISSKRKFWFKGIHCSKTVKRHCLTYTTDSQKLVVENGVSTNCGSSKSWGRIQCYIQNWRILTQDPWILDVVQGKAINWVSVPQQDKTPQPLNFNKLVSAKIDLEVQKMIDMAVIEQCQESQPQFISTLFLREKKGVRAICNLKNLNHFTEYQHFKLEGIPAVIDTIQKGDYMYKIDLSNAYWTIPIHPKDRIWMRFRWKGKTYQFLVWAFGLGPVPRWFTKLMKPVIAFLRRQGTRNVIYMDDRGGEFDLEVSVLHSPITTELLEMLGFVINREKSILSPTQILDDYLGFIINSQEMSLFLPMKKILKIQQACRNLLQKKTVSVRELSKVLGQLVATARAVFQAPLHYRKLQMSQISTLLKNQRRYS